MQFHAATKKHFCFGNGLIPSPLFLLPHPSFLSSLPAPPAPAQAVQPFLVTACAITMGLCIVKQIDAAPNHIKTFLQLFLVKFSALLVS